MTSVDSLHKYNIRRGVCQVFFCEPAEMASNRDQSRKRGAHAFYELPRARDEDEKWRQKAVEGRFEKGRQAREGYKPA